MTKVAGDGESERVDMESTYSSDHVSALTVDLLNMTSAWGLVVMVPVGLQLCNRQVLCKPWNFNWLCGL